MCEFCETNDANRLFRGLKVAKSGLNAGFWSWERGFLWWVLPIYMLVSGVWN